MSSEMMMYGLIGLGFIVVVGLAFAFADGGSGKAAQRAKQIARDDRGKTRRKVEEGGARRRQTQAMLATLREREQQRRKSLVARDLGARLEQAGLSMDEKTWWIVCAVIGVVFAFGAFMSGADGMTINGISLKSRPAVVILGGFVGMFGFPRFILSSMTKRRNKKMTNQFADGIDIIVRGVKSGLPLAECLRIIAAESPEPLKSEFVRLTDNIAMGTNLDRALQQFYRRVPLPEVNFFVIVLSIQSKSGGNLSEALGNLSGLIRARKMMREKVNALSQEAKASAMIIGFLPFAVMVMVYLTTPEYMMKLFTTSTGHFILLIGAGMMTTGITVMKKMISFDI